MPNVGCSVAPSSPATGVWLLLAGLALVMIGRRERRRRGSSARDARAL